MSEFFGYCSQFFIVIRLDGEDIAVSVVGVFVAEIALDNLDELILRIIGVTKRLVSTAIDRGDIAEAIIRVGIRIRRGAAHLLGQARDQRRCAVARDRLIRIGLRESQTGSDGVFPGQSLQSIISEAQRVADTACGNRHGAHCTVRVIVYVTVGLTEAAARSSSHTAGVRRHAALAVIGIVGNRADHFAHHRIRSAKTTDTVASNFSGGKHRPERRCLPD